MSLILHLLRWDIRRFKMLVYFSLVLTAVSAVLEGTWPAIAVAMEARQTVTLTGSLLALVEVLFSMVLITLVVQEHPLVGTSAFWMTRPIPPQRLFVAKLILLSAVIVAAPLITEVVLMAVYDVPIADIAWVAAQTLFFRTLWLATLMAFAAPTLNMAKFAFAVGGMLIGTWAVLITVNAVDNDRAADAPPIPPVRDMYDPTPETVGAILVVVAVAAFLLILYQTRDRVRSIAIGAAGVAIACGIGSVWTWPFLTPRIQTPAWAADSSALQLSPLSDDVNVREGADYGYEAPVWTVARARMRVDGLPPGWSSEASVREASLRVSGRDLLTSRVPGPPASPAIGDAERQKNAVMRQVLNVERLVDWSQQSRPESAVVMVARIRDLRQLATDTAAYEGRFRVSLTRHDVEAILPLGVGSSVRVGGFQFILDRIRIRQNRTSLLVRESDASSMFARQPRDRIEYYIRNRQTSEAVQASWRQLRNDVTLGAFLPMMTGMGEPGGSGFQAHALSLEFPSSYGAQQTSVFFDDTWMERAELVIVRSTEAGAVERRVAIADFPIRVE